MNFYYLLNYLSIILPILPILLIVFFNKNPQKINKTKLLFLNIFLLLITIVLIYSRFVEPKFLLQNEVTINTGFPSKIVLISDLHVGAFSSPKILENVVTEINKIEEVDFVVIAGDIVYHPSGSLDTLLSPLKEIKSPVYIVLGNHDSENIRNSYEKEIKNFFSGSNFHFLKNNSEYIDELNINVLGLGDLWAKEADITKINLFTKEDNLIVIAHSPDTVYKYKNTIPDLTLSGHTHGGQIRIPFIYKWFIPSKYEFDQGLYNTLNGKVYVSSGIGNTGLPFRLGIPPCIDVLKTY